MRTTDDLQDVERFQPLGAPLPKPAPAPAPAPKSQGEYGIATGPDGRLRTTKQPKD